MFAEFVGAFKMHCAYEEAVLKKLINNDRALQDHLKEHLACLNLLSEHASDLIKGKVLIARSFLLSIRKLFLDHLTQGDLSMTKLIKKNAS
jgi:hemerythrin